MAGRQEDREDHQEAALSDWRQGSTTKDASSKVHVAELAASKSSRQCHSLRDGRHADGSALVFSEATEAACNCETGSFASQAAECTCTVPVTLAVCEQRAKD